MELTYDSRNLGNLTFIEVTVSGDATDDDIPEIYDAMERAAASGTHVTAWHLKASTTATVRAAIGKKIRQMKDADAFADCLGNAMICYSRVTWGAAVALDWLSGGGYGAVTKYFMERGKAIKWLEDHCVGYKLGV